jgi:hypothetical protein
LENLDMFRSIPVYKLSCNRDAKVNYLI